MGEVLVSLYSITGILHSSGTSRCLKNSYPSFLPMYGWQSQTRLTRRSQCHWTCMWTSTVPSWSVALHAARLYYYSIYRSYDLIYCPIILAQFFFLQVPIIPKNITE